MWRYSCKDEDSCVLTCCRPQQLGCSRDVETTDNLSENTTHKYVYLHSVFGCHGGDGQYDGGCVHSLAIRKGTACT